jgi:hypothetical protein
MIIAGAMISCEKLPPLCACLRLIFGAARLRCSSRIFSFECADPAGFELRLPKLKFESVSRQDVSNIFLPKLLGPPVMVFPPPVN